eukprot:GHUV01029262.1.p1 GENE.GHUV01029262.1~~GHUV01029262.1.p1  ORF type:complete len:638 (+),score=216.01 GHUV01029262.1:649-2562(+)
MAVGSMTAKTGSSWDLKRGTHVQVGTEDGRVKVVGADGVELLLGVGGNGAGTQQLVSAANRAGIVRLDKSGVLQLFSIDPASTADEDDPSKPLDTLTVDGDKVCCLAALPREPYLLLGCSSGSIKVAALVNASGTPVTEARQIRGLQLTQYSIPPRKLDAAGAVTLLSVLSQPPYQHLLAVHEESGAVIWDLRAQVLVARVRSDDNGQVTAAAWLHNSSKGDFATGHASGDINIWSLPAGLDSSSGSWQAAGSNTAEQLKPLLLEQLQVVPRPPSKHNRAKSSKHRTAEGAGSAAEGNSRGRCRAVLALQHVPGHKESLLVLGGGDIDRPDGLVLLPLPEPSVDSGIEDPTSLDEQQRSAAAAAYNLPWLGPICGHALVPPQGSILGHEAPAALLVLLEGGQVFLHELAAVTGIAANGSSIQVAGSGTPAAVVDERGSQGSPSRLRKQQGSPAKQREQQEPSSRAKQQQQHLEPVPPQRLLVGRLQGQPQVTAARLRMIPIDRVPLSGLQGACMSSLHDWASNSDNCSAAQSGCSWVLTGGKAAEPASSCDSSRSYATLYCTGHADGSVRLWAMHGQAPQLLGKVPSNVAKQALKSKGLAKAAPVSTLEFAWEQGLLVSGHEGGEVSKQLSVLPLVV